MDEYNAALEEERKKKRKKDTKNNSSFMKEYREELDEIAPVAKESSAPVNTVLDEKGLMNSLKNRSWFQAGALDDDAPWYEKAAKAWMGTGKDLGTDIAAGILGMGEKAVDAGAYLLGGGAGLIGQDKFQNKMQDFIQKDLYDEEKVARSTIARAILSPTTLIGDFVADKMGVDEEEDSILGEKSDALAQSGGQLLGTVALQAAGVPWFVTSGVTSFGAEAEGALNEGASYGAAGLSAAVSAGSEILTEKLFGGSGLGEKGLINLEPLTKGVSSKLVKALADYGVDMLAEGSEEVVAEFAGNLASALYKEENLGQLLFSEEAVDGYIESFVGGAALGGGMNVGKVSSSIKTGRDYRTELTANEQKVVDKLYTDAVAEESKNGKVTEKRKSELYDSIVEQMDKGYISTDAIESILGGETYKSYTDTVKSEDSLVEQEKALTEEFNKLNRKPWRDMTGEEHDRLDELKEQLPKLREQIKANEKTGKRNQLKSQLSTEVSQMVKGDRLVESYNERIRMTQDFEADFNKYKGTKHEDAAKKTLESAIKAGANNSNRVRDLVEMAAQASADTGLTFEFKSGENIKKDFIARQTAEIEKLEAMERTAEQDQKLQKLKETLAKVESGEVVVNGDISGGNIVLNLDSKKPLNRVVGHEITHSFEPGKGETSKEYTALKDSLFAYAKTKGIDVDAKLKSLADQYEGVTDANPEAELVADLVGDFLFTDSKYIQKLSTENRNLFQRLWDEVKYLCKIATAGSQEARELARVQKAFEDAYRNGAHKTTGTKHSISETTDGRFVAVVDNDILSNIDTSSWDNAKKAEAKKAATTALKNFSGGIVVDGITRKVNRTSRREFTRSKDTERLYKNSPDIFADKMRAAEVVDDIVVAATNWNRDGGLKHPRSDDFVDFDHGKTLIVSGNAKYSAEVVVGITDTGEAVFYDVVDMTPTSFDLKKEESPTTATTQNAIGDIQGDSSADTVAQNDEDVKHQLSLTESQNEQGLDREQEVQYSLSRDTEFSDKAISMNDSSLRVSKDVMANAQAIRERIAARMTEIKDNGLVGLPEDIEGNTYIANSSYDGTEENTTICPRSLASEAFVDAVSEYLGRPLTVEEQIYISQDLQGRSLTPECTYCYVATDRKAYRAFLGDYINQRDSVLQKLKENPTADISRSGELYKEFLGGRKDTNPMYSRFKMWVDAYKTGAPMVEASHLANLSKLMGDINSEFGEELKPQIVDAMKYAQSASWAKKRVNYVAYNGHILKWKQDRINKLNSHYGLRMYSFSDFHPAFVLENMQMITDASVKGLKMLGYTKDTDFVDIFAPSGMNINVSTFGFEMDGNVYENNIIGANWEKAKALRAQYPNVGITFVATNDTLVNWALEQDWIDVVIPYHLVRTGAEVAKAFNYTNYTSESSDVKDTGWKKGDKKYIAPTEHNNDKATYLAALEKNHLKPRFARFLDNPNYMKLVNECRQSASMSKPVQPVFNEEAANAALSKLEANGYYQPIGGSVERMYEIAAEVADNMIAPTQNSLSAKGEDIAPMGDFDVYGSDFGVVEGDDGFAPVAENAPTDNAKVAETEATEMFPDDIAPVADDSKERLASLGDADAPPEAEPYYGEDDAPVAPRDPFESRDFKAVGKKGVHAYMYDNPEVKPFFQMQAKAMLGDLQNSVKGERWYNDDVYYESGGERGWSGTERQTTDDIAYLLDMGYTYAQIEKGLNAIIEDNGAENIAMAKRIEFALNDRLSKGYTDINGVEIPADEDYLKVLAQKQAAEAVEGQIAPHTDADAPMEDIAPVKKTTKKSNEPKVADVKVNEEVKTKKSFGTKVRDAWDSTKKTVNTAVSTFGDKGWVFENLSKKTKNRELEAKYNFLHYSESRAQQHIRDNLMPIVERVKQTGKTKDAFTYVYHLHNIDRMSLESDEHRAKRLSLRENFKGLTDKQIESIAMEWIKKDTPEDVKKRIKLAREYIDANKGKNKPVFGDSVTADVSREAVKKYEAENPAFKELGEAVVEYNRQLRKMLVDGNVISQKTADMWEKMYPHYVPIRRTGKDGLGVTVPLDTNKTGVNAPIKRATGGDSDIEDLFETMVMRTEQTFKAIAKNSFGVELMHTLGTPAAKEQTSLDKILDSFDSHEDLLQEGKNGNSPTFTVFEDGKRVTFDITKEMYDALKPTSENLAKTYKIPNKLSNIHRGLLTDKNPVFLATNAVKDVQDVMINSQHAGKTYVNFPAAIKELAAHGHWYKEYMANGGEQNTYFDSESKTFKGEDKGVKKWLNMISEANNFIERIPRLAEYIASRKAGRSIEVSMLDAARVTTNFAAGADMTKFLNRNGFTFLNASVQGAMQQVRNVREANTNGLKGWAILAGKVLGVGLTHTILNHLLWDDDEDYEELSDYVKQNYYIVAKTDDGKFIRIPKGRTMAVIQEAFTQMDKLITGDDEVDLGNFAELVISNLAPNNPLDNNILAPAIQAVTNTAWYGGDIVPTRLQDLPSGEQYDESTDAFSKWLGEKTDFSPYKINYLLNQYSGGIGDVFLPMMTPEAESGDNSVLGNIVAPWKDKFSTDPVMNNQNISDFYDKMDEMTKNAKSSKATDEDALKYKYMNSVNAELAELYKQKREIQSSDLSDSEKYSQVYDIQQKIVDLTRGGLDSYGDVNIDGKYATVGDVQFRWYEPGEDSEAEPGWKKLTADQIEKQDEVTKGLGISPSEYWDNKDEYDFAYEYPDKYEFLNDNGVTYDTYKNGSEEFKEAWTWASKNPEKFTLSKAVAGDVVTYRKYTGDLNEIKADKDSSGKSITGSRKEKVIDYVNNMDADYGAKIILFKSEYPSDDTYNSDIVDYLNSREDISYEEMVTILKELGFTVDSNGNVSW